MDTLKKTIKLKIKDCFLQIKTKIYSKRYTELWDKIKYLIETTNGKIGDYDEKYMKFKFSSDDDSPLNKILSLHNMTIVARSVFQKDNKSVIHKFS